MRVLCTRPNAAELISGVRFTRTDDGMLSEDISDEQAQAFAAIPGYALQAPTEKPRRTGRPPKHEAMSDDQ